MVSGGLGVGLIMNKTPDTSLFKREPSPSLPTIGGGHTRVGRPVVSVPGALERTPRMATIKGDAMRRDTKPGYQTRSLFFSDRETI